MQQHLALAPFDLSPDGVWNIPGASGLVDLVPPGQDADPEVNYALVASEERLSNEWHYFGEGDPRELQVQGEDRDAWESVTGFRPLGGTLGDCLAQHLTVGSQPTGSTRTRPVIGPMPEIWLAGERIWSTSLSNFAEPIEQAVFAAELQNLRDIHQQDGEAAYQRYLWWLQYRYGLSGTVSEWLPQGDELLPWLDPLQPFTSKTENWPSAISPVSGQDQMWVSVSGTWSMASAGVVQEAGGTVGRLRLDYAFGGSDRHASVVLVNTANFKGILGRSDSSGANGYFGYNTMQVYKWVSSSATLLGTGTGSFTTNDVLQIRTVGTGHSLYKNGSQTLAPVTDSAVASGLYTVLITNSTGGTPQMGQVIADDTISAGGAVSKLLLLGVG